MALNIRTGLLDMAIDRRLGVREGDALVLAESLLSCYGFERVQSLLCEQIKSG